MVSIAVIGDIHGNIKALKRILPQLKQVDIIFITGDIPATTSPKHIFLSILSTGKVSRANYGKLVYSKYLKDFTSYQINSSIKIFDLLLSIKRPIIFTHGNCEVDEVRELFKEYSKMHTYLFYIEKDVINFQSFVITGYGYCQPATYRNFSTPGEKSLDDLQYDLNELEKKFQLVDTTDKITVCLLHEPPSDSSLDYIDFKKFNGGNSIIRTHLEKNRYDLCFAGHIHESQNYEKHSSSLWLNPGSLVTGKWALLDFKNHHNTEIQLKNNPPLFSFTRVIYTIRRLFS